ncbi:MAG TPA: V-type ATPase subunit, partial [Candidatus Paceibacterota bacterium]|nr:V-type ATPase subunit [Candidatus Paceibacterota bacterium]
MIRDIRNNPDFLAALLHGRRSHMAERERLEALCRIRTIRQFESEISPGSQTDSIRKIQQRLAQDLAREITRIAARLVPTDADLIRWLAVRFQVENLKVLLRSLLTGIRPAAMLPHLLPLPRELAWNVETVETTQSMEDLAHLLPQGPMRKSWVEAVAVYEGENRPFFFEAALDRAYFRELLARTEALTGDDRDLARPLVLQEIDTYHLMLVARGVFIHRLEAKILLPLHVTGTGISHERFTAMLTDPDLRAAAGRALGRALDTLPAAPTEASEPAMPVDPAGLEALAWNRFLRLANRAFRRSHMGFAA